MDYFQELKISRDSSPEKINRAFTAWAFENHPDKKPGTTELFQEVSAWKDALVEHLNHPDAFIDWTQIDNYNNFRDILDEIRDLPVPLEFLEQKDYKNLAKIVNLKNEFLGLSTMVIEKIEKVFHQKIAEVENSFEREESRIKNDLESLGKDSETERTKLRNEQIQNTEDFISVRQRIEKFQTVIDALREETLTAEEKLHTLEAFYNNELSEQSSPFDGVSENRV